MGQARDTGRRSRRYAESADVAKNLVVKSEQSGNRITIEAVRPEPYSGISFNSNRSVNLILSVPRKINLQAKSGDGGVRLEGLEGRIDVKSGDGGINGHDLAGDVYVRTRRRRRDARLVNGRLDLNTGDGGIQVGGTLTKSPPTPAMDPSAWRGAGQPHRR